jgi:hypothetical protein
LSFSQFFTYHYRLFPVFITSFVNSFLAFLIHFLIFLLISAF